MVAVGVDEDASKGELALTLLLSVFCKLLIDVVELDGDGTGEGVKRSAEWAKVEALVMQKPDGREEIERTYDRQYPLSG